jgi:hypothetical protein
MSDMTIPSSAHPLRRRLWKWGGLAAIFILTVSVANFFVPANEAITRAMLGHDFLAFYSAGAMARRGDFHDLYDLSAIKAAESATGRSAGMTVGFGPFWNPPFAAWMFAPFTYLPFSWALVGADGNGGADGLHHSSGPIRSGRGGLAKLGIDRPADADEQSAGGRLHAWAKYFSDAAAHLHRGDAVALSPGGAGRGAAGLLLYKPQHAAIISLALVVSLGWRSALGLACTTAALGAITLCTMPGRERLSAQAAANRFGHAGTERLCVGPSRDAQSLLAIAAAGDERRADALDDVDFVVDERVDRGRDAGAGGVAGGGGSVADRPADRHSRRGRAAADAVLLRL